MLRLVNEDLNAEFLIFPNHIVFSYPITFALPKGIGRAVRQRLKRDLKEIHTLYEPRYTIESFMSHPYAKEISDADLEGGQVDQDYIDSVNLLWYIGHQCSECQGYRTDVGFNDEGKLVYQSLECGHILVDTTETVSSSFWVTNLMGGTNE